MAAVLTWLQKRTKMTSCVLLCLMPLIALLACETTPAPDPLVRSAGQSSRAILLLPLNVVMALQPEVEEPSDRVWAALKEYIEAHGKRDNELPLRDARRIWLESVRKIEASEDASKKGFENAVRLLAINLRQHFEFDAVFVPSLFVQIVSVRGRTAKWDQVKRRVEFPSDAFGDKTASVSSLTTMAASLHVVVLDAQGNKLLEEQAGLELLYRYKWERESGNRWLAHPELRPDLFRERSNLNEGIGKALAAFWPPFE